ncbi:MULTISPECIES: MarR family winged helix-turn-helix transcriptional regulator [Mycobacterium]|uniref:MarR family transcriptional regulator n=1 Tax=Mycobacterium kiyosense TaxID=2871094 RepID=A0A9P3Q6F6_9MYCO|nr:MULTISPECIES: MarR family transcriptional regulator [Mycobacterium]BDB39890.1 MarR family transcriptional regulator [Mycobacterium kiyosense]BDE11741.1 MarR family transcriptional regulator [Mycobacterium sp. 20KCMC460]GLB86525.1 MarR family transcriptional regulator [Mycobacterium kiyosense]GLB88020.1 MarR family transcriptional regulator [Mycobacterium kiyosense]GLB95422.1 MarR family transcriptional regulator [Mycobacterium kiyosense]
MSTHTDLAADIPRTLGRFRRQLRRAVGTWYSPGRLSESQAELLRLVSHRPGVSVSVAAAELGLVPNTASTLVTKLCCAGLLERTPDPADRRVSRLRLTESAQQVMDATAHLRRAVLTDLLDELDEHQIGVLAQGLEVLETMTKMLQERKP